MKLLALVCAALGVAAALGDHKSLREVAQDSQAQHSAETDAAQGSLVEAHAGKALADKAVQSDVGHGSPLLRSAAHDVAGLASAVAAAPDDLCSGDNDNCLYFEYDNATGFLSGDVSIINITGWCNPYSNSVISSATTSSPLWASPVRTRMCALTGISIGPAGVLSRGWE